MPSSTAVGVSPARRAPAAKPAPVRLWAAHLPLVVLVPGVVAWTAFFTFQSWFFYDDFIYFRQAQHSGMSFPYLVRALNVHFSPGYRFVAWAFQSLFPLDFAAAQVILLAGFAASVVLLYCVLVELRGRGPLALAVTALYGTSLVNIEVVQWWSSALQLVPSVTASLWCILFYLRYRRLGSPTALVASSAGLVVGMLFYEKVFLVPLYLVLAQALLLDRDKPLRQSLVAMAREWQRVWLFYLVPAAAYLGVYLGGYWQPSKPASVPSLAGFLGVSWARALVPSVAGLHLTGAPASAAANAGVAALQAGFAALVVWSVVRWRPAWRAWTFFATAFLVNVLIVGVPRVGQWGPGIGYLLRYEAEPTYLLMIALVAAFPGPPQARTAVDRLPAGPGPTFWRARSATVGALALLAAHLVLAAGGASQLARTSPGESGRPYMTHVIDSIHRIEQHGIEPTIVDGTVPGYLVVPWSVYGPPYYNHYSELFRLVDAKLHFDQMSRHLYQVAADGRLRPATFVTSAGGDPRAMGGTSTVTVRYAARVERSSAGLCVRASSVFPAFVELTLTPRLSGGEWYLGLRYSTTRPETVPLFVDHGAGYPYPYDRSVSLAAGRDRSVLADLGSPTVSRLRLDLPLRSTTCLSQVRVGYLTGAPNVGGQPGRAAVGEVGTPLEVAGTKDSFSGPDDPSSLGRVPGGPAWQAVNGTWGVSSHQAYVSKPAPGRELAVVNPGGSGSSAQVRLAQVAQGAGLVFAYRDRTDYWYVAAVPAYASWAVVKVSGGHPDQVATTGLSPVQDGTTVSVAVHGRSAELALDGVVTRIVTDPTLAGASRVGLEVPAAGAAQARFADFSVAAGVPGKPGPGIPAGAGS